MTYRCSKSYGHTEGLSCAFRQWRANASHCHFIHGYALAFTFVFEADKLDDRGWVMDFGNLKGLKQRLKDTFDHKLAVAGDDPELTRFLELHEAGVADVLVFPGGVGIERFAKHAFGMAQDELHQVGEGKRVRVISCTVAEHDGNSGTYEANVFDEQPVLHVLGVPQ